MRSGPSEETILHQLREELDDKTIQGHTSFRTTGEGRGLLAGMRTAISAADSAPSRADVRLATARLLERVAQDERREEHVVPQPSVAARRSWAMVMSGAVLSGLLLVLAWYGGERRVRRTLSNAVSVYTTGNRQQATIALPDGSTVLLNVGSRLEVPTNYGAGNLTVTLRGEALFNVAHHRGAPFTVVAGPSTTRVLGTSFLVRHYPADSAAVIAVRDGKVSVGSTVLMPGQQMTVGWRVAGPLQPSDATQFSFETGVLAFRKTLLSDAIPALNRWYDVDIRLADPALATRRITALFAAGTPADLTPILNTTFDDIAVVQDGRVLTLYRR